MSGTAARAKVLGRIRIALGASQDDDSRKLAARERLSKHHANLIPELGKAKGDSRLAQFTRMLEGQSATVSRAKTLQDIPHIVADYLREHNLPAEFRTGTDPLIDEIPWHSAPSLTVNSGPSEGSDLSSLSHAMTAAAETGTLFLTSGADNPTTLNFLPDTHMIVVRARDILGSYEDAWNALRKTYGEGSMPRTVNLVSGPSRTADIDQIIVMGAHGPRRLHVIILE